jgi:hypothetical protein
MSHFSPVDWVDFTRGLLTPAESLGLRSHLDRGCEECLNSAALWGAVFECVSPERRTHLVPDRVLQSVTAEYKAQKPWKWLAHAARWAEPVFDSFRQPAPALTRASASAGRHLIHEAEPFIVVLRMEPDPTRPRLSLLGQVLNFQNPNEAIPGIEVILLSGEDLIAKASANAAGEFDLQCKLEFNLRLFIHIRGQGAIGIVLQVPDT